MLRELSLYRQQKVKDEAECKPGINPVKLFSPWLENYQMANFEVGFK
jgi:hypothetical protein